MDVNDVIRWVLSHGAQLLIGAVVLLLIYRVGVAAIHRLVPAVAPERKTRLVGVDLQDSSDSHAVVEAIEADNTGVTVNRMPGLVSLRAAREMVIRRESVEARIGREWDTQEFQMNLVSYSGNIDWDDDQIIIKWEH